MVKPGGYAVLSDMHPVTVHMGITAGFPAPELGAAHRAGAQPAPRGQRVHQRLRRHRVEVCECVEPTMPDDAITSHPAYPVVPDAVRDAFDGLPFLLIWKLRRRGLDLTLA